MKDGATLESVSVLSYSAMLKSQLVYLDKGSKKHCFACELYAIIKSSAKVTKKYGETFISLYTENVFSAKHYCELLKATVGVSMDVSVRTRSKSKKVHYLIYIPHADKIMDVIQGKDMFSRTCCKQAYLRGAFVAAASICDPKKNYHLEFVFPSKDVALELLELLRDFDISAGIIVRKKNHVLYIKDGEAIAQILGLVGARKSFLDFENLRIFKAVSNDINRIVNCETANSAKTAKAYVSFQEDIEYIECIKGIAYLPAPLVEIARLKLENPDATLKELGELLNPPISKSGVNHRLRKISEIAEKLRGDLHD